MNPSTPPNKFALPVDFVKGVDEEPSFHPSSTSRFGRPVPMDDVHAAMSVQRNHPGLICSTGDAFEFQPVSKECFGPPLGQPQAVSSRSPSQTRLRKEDYDILEAHFRDEREPDMYTREFLAAIFNVETKMVTNWFHHRRTKESWQLQTRRSMSFSNLLNPTDEDEDMFTFVHEDPSTGEQVCLYCLSYTPDVESLTMHVTVCEERDRWVEWVEV